MPATAGEVEYVTGRLARVEDAETAGLIEPVSG
jgi:hypothetical protein